MVEDATAPFFWGKEDCEIKRNRLIHVMSGDDDPVAAQRSLDCLLVCSRI